MRIEQLGPPGADHSTGLILGWRDQLLFAIEPSHQWRVSGREHVARLVGIGGHVEVDETWTEAVRREAMEEAWLEVTLLSPESTYLMCDDGMVVDFTTGLEWSDPPRPYFIWSARFRLGPPSDERVRHFVTAVFLAAVPDHAIPCARAEMPAIVALSEGQLRRAAVSPIALGDLLAEGARIWEAATISRSVRLSPGGSAEWYAVLLRRLAGNAPETLRPDDSLADCPRTGASLE